eukprot:7966611-Pyramimonas_sp.AAC.2
MGGAGGGRVWSTGTQSSTSHPPPPPRSSPFRTGADQHSDLREKYARTSARQGLARLAEPYLRLPAP